MFHPLSFLHFVKVLIIGYNKRATAITEALFLKILHNLLEEENLLITVSGRMSSLLHLTLVSSSLQSTF